MIDFNEIRNNPEKIKKVMLNKSLNADTNLVDRWLALDTIRSELITKLNTINQERNNLSKTKNTTQREKAKILKIKEQELRKLLTEIENKWYEIASWFPNIPSEDVKIGYSENENEEIYAWTPQYGEIPKDKLGFCDFSKKYMPNKSPHSDEDFEPKHHIDILEKLNLIDMKQAAKVSGSRFYYLIGDLVKLQRAIHEMMLEKLDQLNFTRIIPPLLLKEKILFGTSHFPEGKDQIYKVDSEYLEDKEPLFLVGSSEPSNFGYAYDRTFQEKELPLKLVAITPCFRTEVGNWGKDVRGMKRVHQFDKLEMDVICTQEQSEQIYNELLEINKWLLKELEIPFHIVQKCTGDSGYNASYKQADVEVWLPGQQCFMEVCTNTNTTDYQARRLNIKYIDQKGKKKFAHTVNDTGVADRMLIAIVENYQQKDGTIKVPQKLKKYLQKDYIGK